MATKEGTASVVEKEHKEEQIQPAKVSDEAAARMIEDLTQRLSKQRAQLEMAIAPPRSYVWFRKVMGTETVGEGSLRKQIMYKVEVIEAGGKLSQVFMAEEPVHPDTLVPGQTLVTARGLVVDVLDCTSLNPSIAVVNEVIREAGDVSGSVLVTPTGSQTQLLVEPTPGLAKASLLKLEPGARVVFDAVTRMIVSVLSERASSPYVIEAPTATWRDIGGVGDLRRRLTEDLILPLVYDEATSKIGARPIRGSVWVGPPGTGKTLLLRVVVHEIAEELRRSTGDPAMEVALLYVPTSSLLDKWLGNTEAAIRDVYTTARTLTSRKKLVIVAFDESEGVFGIRGAGISTDISSTTVPQLCTLMDDFQGRGGVYTVLLSNRIDRIDPAVLRPGRCDQTFTFTRPTREGVIEIFKVYLKDSWDEVHTKYNVDIYEPTDIEGRPTGEAFAFRHSASKARDYLVECVVRKLYDESDNVICTLTFADGKSQVVRYPDMISGAIIEGIVNKAKRRAVQRYALAPKTEPLGVVRSDLEVCAAEAFIERAQQMGAVTLESVLYMEGVIHASAALKAVRFEDRAHSASSR